MNSEHIVYILFLVIYLIILYLYYDDYYISSNETNNITSSNKTTKSKQINNDKLNKTNINETFDNASTNASTQDITSLVQKQYYNDLKAIQNISKVAYMINTTNSITISGNISISGTLNLLPPGIVTAYVGTTSPQGWLICDGAKVLINDYKRLYEIIGINFNGTTQTEKTHFTLPDYRNVFLRGKGTPNLKSISNNINYTSSDLYTLQKSQIQNHTHTVIDDGHTHAYDAYFFNIDRTNNKNDPHYFVWETEFGQDNNGKDYTSNTTSTITLGGLTSSEGTLKKYSSDGNFKPYDLDSKQPINITNIKVSNSNNGIDISNISNTDIYPCNVTINWIIKY